MTDRRAGRQASFSTDSSMMLRVAVNPQEKICLFIHWWVLKGSKWHLLTKVCKTRENLQSLRRGRRRGRRKRLGRKAEERLEKGSRNGLRKRLENRRAMEDRGNRYQLSYNSPTLL